MNSGLPLQKVLVRQFTGQQKAMVELQSAVRMAYAKSRIFPLWLLHARSATLAAQCNIE